MKKANYFILNFVLLLLLISCSKEEIIVYEEPANANVIYASKAPYFLKANSDCSINRSEIQNLIDIAANEKKRLVIDKDTYCIDGTLYIPSNLEIDFSGSTIERITTLGSPECNSAFSVIIFDMIRNKDITGNTNIVLKNLIIDGNYPDENLSMHNDCNRFSGLKLTNSSNVTIENVDVIETVNGEQKQVTPAGGIFIDHSENVYCKNVNGYNNFGTAIIINYSNNITIDGSRTENNFATGVGSSNSNYCDYLNLKSFNNGLEYYRQEALETTDLSKFVYSNISVNGKYCKVNNITSSGASGSGLNIGHKDTNPSDYTIVDNVHSYENILEGITITGSKHILLSNVHLEKNARHNLLIHDGSSKVQINNAIIHGHYNRNNLISGNNGIRIESGGGHSIDNSLIYDNYKQGIGVYNVAGGVSIGSETYIYNNGRDVLDSRKFSGLYLYKSQNCYINGTKIYSDQQPNAKTQDYGAYITGGGNHRFIYTDVWGNIEGGIVKDTIINVPSNIEIVN